MDPDPKGRNQRRGASQNVGQLGLTSLSHVTPRPVVDIGWGRGGGRDREGTSEKIGTRRGGVNGEESDWVSTSGAVLSPKFTGH